MSIIEINFNMALQIINNLVEKEKKEGAITCRPIVVQVAYNEHSFELYSAALSPGEDGHIPEDLEKDTYYNMVFIADGFDEIPDKFKNKYLFNLAHADINAALEEAYNHALRSDEQEYTLTTSFFKPAIEDSAWAYNEVFKYTDFGKFLCWFNHDEKYQKVNIQADMDFIDQFDMIKHPD